MAGERDGCRRCHAEQTMWQNCVPAAFRFRTTCAFSSKIGSFRSLLGEGGDTPKFLLDFLLPADTRHVLKFCKNPFRVVDEIGSKNKIAKQKGHTPYGGD